MAAGFLSLLVVSSMPVAELLLVGVAGAFLATARCGNVLTPSARADINRVVYAVFTPALMLASLANTVTLRDVVAWWFMPVNIGIAFLAGGALGWVAVLLLRPPQQLRGLVIASCSAANFGNLLLVVIPAVCEEDGNPFGLAKTICTDHGLSYASFSMALGGLYIWTHTHSIMKRSGEVYRRMRQAASSIAPVTCVVVDPSTESVIRQEENKHSENDGGSGAISPSSQSIVAKGEHQISVPLLSDSSNHHRSAEGKNLWGRLKEGMHEMTQELTSPPTTGAYWREVFSSGIDDLVPDPSDELFCNCVNSF